jgi:hypothetical protein
MLHLAWRLDSDFEIIIFFNVYHICHFLVQVALGCQIDMANAIVFSQAMVTNICCRKDWWFLQQWHWLLYIVDVGEVHVQQCTEFWWESASYLLSNEIALLANSFFNAPKENSIAYILYIFFHNPCILGRLLMLNWRVYIKVPTLYLLLAKVFWWSDIDPSIWLLLSLSIYFALGKFAYFPFLSCKFTRYKRTTILQIEIYIRW